MFRSRHSAGQHSWNVHVVAYAVVDEQRKQKLELVRRLVRMVVELRRTVEMMEWSTFANDLQVLEGHSLQIVVVSSAV